MESAIDQILNKLSSYNIFNYLLPGIVFTRLASDFIRYPIAQKDIVTDAFFYYFVGLVVSRFGSLIIEPLLKWIRFVKIAHYKDFVAASQKDAKLDVLSEVNNMYRTLASLITLLILLKLLMRVEEKFPRLNNWNWTALAVLLLVMFLLSYKKQTSYITKRIAANMPKSL